MTAPVLARDPDFERWLDEARGTPIASLLAHPRMTKLRGEVEKVGPCPDCGGRDRFGVNTRKHRFICRGCHPKGGDVIALAQMLDGCDFLEACETLVGRPPPGRAGAELTPDERAAREAAFAQLARDRAAQAASQDREHNAWRERERERCFQFWTKAVPIGSTPAEAYLTLRAIKAPPDAHLRYAPEHPLFGETYVDDGGRKQYPVLHRGPALLAGITGPDGRFAGVHATWIDPRIGSGDMPAGSDGKLTGVVDPRTGEVMPSRKARGSLRGGRIELVRHDAPKRLFLGEGRETVLAAWCLLLQEDPAVAAESAFWSAIDLGNLGGKALRTVGHPTEKTAGGRARMVPGPDPDPDWPAIPIPSSVEHLYLLGDGDSDAFATACALVRAAARYARPGLSCHRVMAPPGLDWNDVRRRAA